MGALALGPPQHGRERGALERDLQSIARRVEIRQGRGQAPDSRGMRGLPLAGIEHEDESGQVEAEGSLGEMTARGPDPGIGHAPVLHTIAAGKGTIFRR
jgi:hypothetical protein